MKKSIFLFAVSFVLFLLLWSCNSKVQQNGIIEMIRVNGQEIPKLHLDQVDDSATVIRLSELFENFRIIPLETTDESLISLPGTIELTGHSILTWTQVGIGPCRVLEFDLEGRYLREYGRGGRGPGEHGGYVVEELSSFPEHGEVFISFMGMGPENQLFSMDGKFLRSVKNPVEFTGGIKRFNDSIWMTSGSLAGYPEFRRDSIRLIFYSSNGFEIKVWPRSIYPPHGQSGYSPTGWGNSIYQVKDQWHIYSPGDDTLYSVTTDRLDPIAVFDLGKKGSPYNKSIDPSAINGTYDIRIKNETARHWFLEKLTVVKADLTGSGNRWGPGFDMKEFLLKVEKKTGQARNLRFEDDFLGLPQESPERLPIQWTAKGEPYLVFIGVDLKESIKTALKKGNLDPAIKSRLEKLDNQVDENSNPVFILMDIRE